MLVARLTSRRAGYVEELVLVSDNRARKRGSPKMYSDTSVAPFRLSFLLQPFCLDEQCVQVPTSTLLPRIQLIAA